MSRSLIALVAAVALYASPASAQVSPDSDRPAADLYKQTCQVCHAANGASPLEAMNIADGKWKHGTSVEDIAKVIRNGVPGTAMMPFKARFSEKEVLALARYVRAFDKNLKPEPEAKGKAPAKK
jgi:mono/diheme cytochrome c family protein